MPSDGGSNVEDDSNDTGKAGYRKHSWTFVHCWRNITLDEVLLWAEKLMTDNFNVAGGLRFKDDQNQH